jgi:hypothetical protein
LVGELFVEPLSNHVEGHFSFFTLNTSQYDDDTSHYDADASQYDTDTSQYNAIAISKFASFIFRKSKSPLYDVHFISIFGP